MGKREIVDVNLSLDKLGEKEWIKAHQRLVENEFEAEGRKKISGEEIRQKILNQLKNVGLSIREIERATGISRGIIAKS